MPLRPGRICKCGARLAGSDRCACQLQADRARKARHDANRPSATARGYGGKWRKARLAFLALHPCCAKCDEPATVVDHIVPHNGDFAKGGLFWSRRNWQPLCRPCHSIAKQRQERAPE